MTGLLAEKRLKNPFMGIKIIINKSGVIILMQVNNQKQNPFEKSNPFKLPNKMYSQKRELHPSLNLNELMYRPPSHHYNLNIWNFKDDNSRKFNPYIIKQKNELSPFERSVKINTPSTFREAPPKNRLSSSHIQENPFHRKNLLISREELERQIEQDINHVNYKNWIKDPETNRPNAWQTPAESQYRGLMENNGSFMPSQYERDSMGSKKMSKYEYQESLDVPGDLSRRVSFGRKSDAFERKGEFKEEIVVRGKKFYMQKVYPHGRG